MGYTIHSTRCQSEAMFESFDEETLSNTGINWKYEISVLAMGFTIIGRQIHHLKILDDRYYPLLDEQFAELAVSHFP
jgi:hypothetical protein